jgi:hypothetical protein
VFALAAGHVLLSSRMTKGFTDDLRLALPNAATATRLCQVEMYASDGSYIDVKVEWIVFCLRVYLCCEQ